jgi:hypothetical protein
MAEGTAMGRPRNALDMILAAATAEANSCLVATDNDQHFAGVKTVNPIRSQGRERGHHEYFGLIL